MKTIGNLLILAALISEGAQAQDSYKALKNELNQQIEELYPEVQVRPSTRSTVRVEKTEIIEAKPEPLAQQQAPVEVNQIQVVEQAQAQAQQQPIIERTVVRQQPLTIVEAAPLEESEADKLRRNRVDYEQETERKLVEKLETERISDEQRRREAIMKKLDGKPEEVAPVVAPAPVPVQVEVVPEPIPAPALVAPAPVVQETVTELPPMEEQKEETERTQFYIGLQGGVGQFYEVDNIEPGLVGGFALGLRFPENFLVEFAFNYSKYDIQREDSPFYGEVTTWQERAGSLGVKYQFLTETVRPIAGMSMTYRTRDYTDEYAYVKSDDVSTTGLDFGLEGGLDFMLSKHFSIGASAKYFTNLYSDVNSDDFYDDFYADYVGAEDTEELSYWQFGMNLRAYF